MRIRTRRVAALLAGLLLGCSPASEGQPLPAGPLALFDGRLVIGGEISAAIAPDDRSGYFNYTDYEQSALRLVRLAASVAVRPHERLAVLSEIRTENLDAPRAFALYIRARPIAAWPIDVVAGRIPPVFGAYARRPYGSDLLIGYPLAYQYLTIVRPDAVPAHPQHLVDQRGAGWRVQYPIGSPEPAPGVPLVTASRYDTGIGVAAGWDAVEISAALTVGTVANPRVREDNDGRQLAVRVQATPWPALTVGASASRGAFLSRRVVDALPEGLRGAGFEQQAFGADVEVSRDYWLVRGELVHSRWDLPPAGSFPAGERLTATGASVEGRYRITAALYAAARVDRLTFSDLAGAGLRQAWDAPVTRVEVGVGYALQRNLLLKAAVQVNRRSEGVTASSYDGVALQAVYRY